MSMDLFITNEELAEFWGYDSMMAYSGKNSVENIAIRHIEFEEKENKNDG